MPQSDQRAIDIKATVKNFILEKWLPGEDENSLTDATPLLSGGILDSISTIELVAFLEERFGVKFAAYEVSEERLDTLNTIADTITAKLS